MTGTWSSLWFPLHSDTLSLSLVALLLTAVHLFLRLTSINICGFSRQLSHVLYILNNLSSPEKPGLHIHTSLSILVTLVVVLEQGSQRDFWKS